MHGRSSAKAIRSLGSPTTSVAATKSRSRSDSACERSTLASAAHVASAIIPIVAAVVFCERGRIPATSSAIGSIGITRNPFVTELTAPSTQPPNVPARSPAVIAMSIASTVAPAMVRSVSRPPCRTWARTSKPSFVVPNGKRQEGCAARTSVVTVPLPRSHGAAIEAATRNARIVRPARALPFARTTRSHSGTKLRRAARVGAGAAAAASAPVTGTMVRTEPGR